MGKQDILKCEYSKLVEKNDSFSLYLFSATPEKDVDVIFQSDQLAIFICLSGKLISSTQTLSYHLSEKLISFALRHDCKKIVPKGVFTEFLILTFSQKTLENLIKTAGEDVYLTMSHFTSCQCTVHNCSSEILTLSRKILKECTEKYWGHRMNLQFIFQELLVSFVRLFTADKTAEKDLTAEKAKEILGANPQADLDLDDLADKCGVSKSHLCRLFKKATGQTVSQYLNKIRIETACQLLSDTDKPIEEIAFLAGFNNPSYFFRVFKKQTGKLPLAWRKTASFSG